MTEQKDLLVERDVQCVMADPPWHLESGGGESKRGADRHYELMKPDDVIHTVKYDCAYWQRLAEDAHLWLWCTNATLAKSSQMGVPDAHHVARGLGFEPTTLFTWVKMAPRKITGGEGLAGEGELDCDAVMRGVQKGLGQYSYGATEHMLFCTRGDFMKPDPEDRHPTVFFAPLGEHSEKPEIAYEIAEDVSPGKRLELFAREEREGWVGWGNEV